MLVIDRSTTVRDMIRACPATFDILLARGMCADCRADPPPVSLEHFARKHCGGDIDSLLAELRQVIDKP